MLQIFKLHFLYIASSVINELLELHSNMWSSLYWFSDAYNYIFCSLLLWMYFICGFVTLSIILCSDERVFNDEVKFGFETYIYIFYFFNLQKWGRDGGRNHMFKKMFIMRFRENFSIDYSMNRHWNRNNQLGNKIRLSKQLSNLN